MGGELTPGGPSASDAHDPEPAGAHSESGIPASESLASGHLDGLTGQPARKRRLRIVVAVLAALVVLCVGGGLAATVTGSPGGSAQPSGVQVVPPSQQVDGQLDGVSVVSPTSAWAVGVACDLCLLGFGQALIMHWDGTSWSQVRSPRPGHYSALNGVASGPRGTAWAVGGYCATDCGGTSAAGYRTLIMHWNGAAWSRIPSPNPGAEFAILSSVSSGPGGTAWAVGGYCSHCDKSAAEQPLILHWNGAIWSQVPSPVLRFEGELTSVTAAADGSAWAVGQYCPSGCGKAPPSGERTLIMHWNGTAWSQVTGPAPGSYEILNRVVTDPAGDAWASGLYCASACQATPSGVYKPLILRWNGSRWSQVPSPAPGLGGALYGASLGPGGSAYASGVSYCSCKTSQKSLPLILRWDGSRWTQVASPSLGSPAHLFGVGSGPGGSNWTVGFYCTSGCNTKIETDQTLILHWQAATR